MKEQIAVQNAAMEKKNVELEADFEHLAHVREIAAIEAAIKTLQNRRRKSKRANEHSISSEKGINRKICERPSR